MATAPILSLRGQRAAPPSPFGVWDLIAVARKRARVICNVALGVIAATLAVLIVLPSSYTGTAVVMLDPRKNNVAELSSVLSEQPTDPASVQNQIQILTSRDLAGEVIQNLGLAGDSEFNAALQPSLLNPVNWVSAGAESAEARYAKLIDNFLKHVSVDGIGLSTAISVKVSSRDPDKAARIANAIVDAYIQSQIAGNAEAAHHTTVWLVQRIRELARQDQTAEANVQRYKAEHAINDTGTGTSSVVEQQLAAINTQLVQARADLAAKEANYERITSLLKSGDAADVSQVVSSPLIVQLRTQQSDAIRDTAQLASRYGPKHPKRVAAESQLRDLQAKIDQEVNRIAGSVANDVAVGRAQVKSLESSLARAEAEDNDQNLARVQLKALESDAASTRTMYESFVTRLREIQGRDAVPVSDARVISHASVPTSPSSPKRLIVFGASVPAAILLGLLWALILERLELSGGIAPMQRPAVPVLAEIPAARLSRAADLASELPTSPFARGMWSLARRLDGGPSVLAVTSFDSREGQSSIAVGLSRALAQGGKRVILIDAQPPATAWTIGITPAQADAVEALKGDVPLSRLFQRDPRSDVLLLSAHPNGVWRSPRAAELVTHLRRSADIVVVDAPQLWAEELSVIAPFVQGFLVVARKRARLLTALSDAAFRNRYGAVGLVLTS